jgi:peptide/nickel transport system substrate-binding protein
MRFRIATITVILLLLIASLAFAQGGTVVVALERDVESTDPSVGGTIDAVNYNQAIADHLVYMGDEGLEPWVIENWEVTPEGIYTWRIRQGITFHDGTVLDADAVKFNIDRLRVPENNLRYGSYFQRLQSIEVIDDYTLELNMGAYDLEFMERMINIGIVSPTAVEALGEGFRDAPVGSGPFIFESYTPGERIVLRRNPNYWRSGEPLVDELVFRIIPEASVRLIELEAGTVHYAVNMAAADLAEAERAGLEVVRGPALGRLILYMNLERITDPAVRRAVNHAIDRQVLVDVVTNGLAEVAFYAVPRSSWAYNPDIPTYPYDIERANAILDEAGWVRGADGVRAKDGERLVWDMPADSIPSRLRAAEIIAAMLNEIGIQVNIRSMDSTAFTDTARGGDHHLAWFQWAGSTFDPWVAAGDLHCNYAWNIAQYCDPELDALVEEALVSQDQERRQELYDAFFTRVQEEAFYVAVGHLPAVFVARPEIEGVRIVGGRLLFNEARLID